MPADMKGKLPFNCSIPLESFDEANYRVSKVEYPPSNKQNNRNGTGAFVRTIYKANGVVNDNFAVSLRIEPGRMFTVQKSDMSNKYSAGIGVEQGSTLYRVLEITYNQVLDSSVACAHEHHPVQFLKAVEATTTEAKDAISKKKKGDDKLAVAREMHKKFAEADAKKYEGHVRARLSEVFVFIKTEMGQAAMLSPGRNDNEFNLNFEFYVKNTAGAPPVDDGLPYPTLDAAIRKKIPDRKGTMLCGPEEAWSLVGRRENGPKICNVTTLVLKSKKLFNKADGKMISLGFSAEHVVVDVPEALEYDPDSNEFIKPESESKRVKGDSGAAGPPSDNEYGGDVFGSDDDDEL